MYINVITSENTPDSHKEVITSQIPMTSLAADRRWGKCRGNQASL